MKKRIFTGTILGLFILTLIGCSTLYQNTLQNDLYDSSPYTEMLSLVPKSFGQSSSPSIEGWQRLVQIGPGSDALVTLRDGTLRGGKIVTVTSDSLGLITSGQVVSIARSEIALVQVKGSSGALAGGLIGYIVGGLTLTAIVSGGEDIPPEGWILGTAILGIPTGLIGVLIGSQSGGDEEIVP